MSRTLNSLRNSKVSFIFIIIKLLLTFWSRRVFIDVLGSDLVGLNSTLINILGFLNLAELGITAALAAVLYDPLYNNDRAQIKHIISIFGFLFKRIATIILTLGIALSFFLPMIFDNSGVSIEYVYIGYFTFLASSLAGYYFNYKQNILEADQKNYIVNTVYSTSHVVKLLLQIVALKYFDQGYYFWIVMEMVAIIANTVFINVYINKHYPWLRQTTHSGGKELIKDYPHIIKTIKNIIPHKFGGFILNQTTNILIFAFVSLSMVTVYNNYFAIISSLLLVLTAITNGQISIIGNLVSENNKEKTRQVFGEFMVLFFTIGGIIQICLTYMMTPFVKIWIGPDYALPTTTVILVIYNFYLAIVRMPVSMFLHGHKLYQDTWAPWAEASLNLLVAIIAGYYYGIFGVLLGATISLTLAAVVWKPIFLCHSGFKTTTALFWKQTIPMLVALGITNAIIYTIINLIPFLNQNNNFGRWTINALIIFVIASTTLSLLTYTFTKKTSALLVKRVKMIIFGK